ncbi:polymorphic toxin type 27 domain-containing protein [Streptomyces sp. NPDC002232]|uniref:polymorphic toxin type 27 domain-containing protein n=1 Tax=Streptomyces sp. NPDC002232 TaxID=3364640 RepID=UPI0036B0E303
MPLALRRGAWRGLLAATALTTALAAVASSSGLQSFETVRGQSIASAADVPVDFDLGNAEWVRKDQCRLNYVLRKSVGEMASVARSGFAAGSEDQLHAIAWDKYWEGTPLSRAFSKDREYAVAKSAELTQRVGEWQKELNVPTSYVPGYNNWPPGATGDTEDDIFVQTGYTKWVGNTYWADSESDFYVNVAPVASRESADSVHRLMASLYHEDEYADMKGWQAWKDLTWFHPMYADDARLVLQYGDFPRSAPEPDSAEFRIDVENLKARFASCVSSNPPDPYNVLGAEVAVASVEWQQEIAGQKSQFDAVLAAGVQANKALQVAVQAMGEALGQSMIASRLASWRAYWTTQSPDSDNYPTATEFAEVDKHIQYAQGRAGGRLYVASRAMIDANAQVVKAEKAKAEAYAIADAAGLPRGRGLMYGLQAVQVAKASAAAAAAAVKATETALHATRASAADAKALSALAMTQAHAAKADFRREAAEEAARQAKAAAEGAAAQAAKASENAAKAKAAETKAKEAEAKAKTAAEAADAKRVKAQAEAAYAKSQKELADAERGKASAAETKARNERQTAADQLAAAQAAGETAASKKDAALAAEIKASKARDGAREAERRRDSLVAKAEAAEALFAAVDGTAAAIEARDAATKARTAANNAGTAATSARSAANQATDAATNAREDATRAEGAAKRAQALADGAKRDVAVTEAALKTAHAAAAEAIDAAGAAKWNAVLAKAEAETAQLNARKAKADAAVARSEAVLAGREAVRAAGFAYATAQAAKAAGESAQKVIKPANDAIELGAPYQDTDASAGLAVLTGQAAKSAAVQQAALAKAKADQAAAAAKLAQKVAAEASADAKAAAVAAAEAAVSSAQALASAEAAQKSSNAADASAKAAQQSEANTTKYHEDAVEDAAAAQSSADTAANYADQADAAATEAEQDAASARSSADSAEADAGKANNVADRAEQDATAAEEAAENARNLAVEAVYAAIRTENDTDEVEQEQERSGTGPVGIDGVVMRPSDETLVDIDPKSDCVGTHSGGEIGCEIDLEYHIYGEMDFYLESCPTPGVSRASCGSSIKRDYLMSAPLDVRFRENKVHVDGLELSASVLKALAMGAVQDIWGCLNLKLGNCLWLAGSLLIPPALSVAAKAALAVRAAVVSGLRISTALWGLRGSGLSASAIANLERAGTEALLGRCFPAGTKVSTESGAKPIEQIKIGDRVWSSDPVTGKKSLQRVLNLFNRSVDQLVRVETATGSVEATDSHRFWVESRGWVEARDLRAGDRFRTKEGATEKVRGTALVKGTTKVYNFEVENLNSYYVYAGPTPVLVHNECTQAIIGDLVREGDHIVLGVNPYSDTLAESLKGGARTFNAREPYGSPHPSGDGRPIWMVAVESAFETPNVTLSITLDGVADATSADRAIQLLLERGKPLIGPDWRLAAQGGNGTAWEIATLRLKVLRGFKNWDDIKWYMTKPGKKEPSLVEPSKPDWAY